jgi:hypothetical protein
MEFTAHLKDIRGAYQVDFTQVVKLLKPKEIEDLLVEAYSDFNGRPFVVENIRVIGGKKEVDIRYMATNIRRTVEVGHVKVAPAEAVEST